MTRPGPRRHEGEAIGDYVLSKFVEAGPALEVWEAEHRDAPDRRVRFEFPAPGAGSPLAAKPDLFRDLDHPNVEKLEAFDLGAEVPWLRWEAGPGELLGDRLRRGPLRAHEVHGLVRQALQALAYARRKGLSVSLDEREIGIDGAGRARFRPGVTERPVPASEDPARSVPPEVSMGGRRDGMCDLYDLGVLVHRVAQPGTIPPTGSPTGLGPAWDRFAARLRAPRGERIPTPEAALEELPADVSRPLPSWLAGPFFIVGVFLVSYVALGFRPLPPSLKILTGIAGFLVAGMSGRAIRHPWPSAFFWGGLFWAYSVRMLGPWPMLGALTLALAAGVVYVRRVRGDLK